MNKAIDFVGTSLSFAMAAATAILAIWDVVAIVLGAIGVHLPLFYDTDAGYPWQP